MAAVPPTSPSRSPVALRDVFARIESGGNPFAIRFEPSTWARNNFQSLFTRVVNANKCDVNTARMLLASSFGLYQIMGFNLYNPGICDYRGPIALFLNNVSDQNKAMDAFLDAANIRVTPSQLYDPATRARVARLYNGPGDVSAYSFKLLKAITDLQVKK